jgi:hypothetical protein
MSNPLTDILTGGLSGITDSVKGILDKFITDPEKKLEATLQVEQLKHDLEVKVLEADKDLAVQQASVIVAETKSESWLARNWRPILMVTFTYIIAHNYVFATLFHLTVVPIPPDMWDLLKLGMTGYIVGRTVEKVAPDVTAAITAGKSK